VWLKWNQSVMDWNEIQWLWLKIDPCAVYKNCSRRLTQTSSCTHNNLCIQDSFHSNGAFLPVDHLKNERQRAPSRPFALRRSSQTPGNETPKNLNFESFVCVFALELHTLWSCRLTRAQESCHVKGISLWIDFAPR